ncbi:TadE family protein [Georgenia daeguensis]|uniref:TadE/TadG family type IV pilus assembly protein n=1 Tax=Georgenia daeguensis TaxID=908355 RepID=UPI0031F16A27
MNSQRSDRGAAAVEFALIVPILLLLVLGITEFGRAYNVQTTLSDAARAGVRTMAIHNSVSEAKESAKAAAASLPLADAQITVEPLTCDGSTEPARVSVEHSVDLIFFPDVTLTGKGTMRCNG